jgi:hypothetical protein
VTVALPEATPVKVTEQLPAVNIQLAPTVPTAVFDDVKLTEPVGVFAAFVVSVTVAVQLEVPLAEIELGLQTTAVAVLSFTIATEMVFDVPELPLWVGSPPYVPVTVALPVATPVKVTEQLETVVDVAGEGDKVQLAPTVPIVVFDDVKPTEPLGAAVALGGLVISVTVAVQLVVPPGAIIVGGPQVTPVDVLSTAGGGVMMLATSARLSGTEPPVPPLVMVTQVFGTLVPVQTDPIT